MNTCPRCNNELKTIVCKDKCLKCGYSLDCSDL